MSYRSSPSFAIGGVRGPVIDPTLPIPGSFEDLCTRAVRGINQEGGADRRSAAHPERQRPARRGQS